MTPAHLNGMSTPSGADRSRQPAGLPVGGQFAASARPESQVSLTGPLPGPSEDDLDFARETLGPDATDDEVRDLAEQRLDRDEPETPAPALAGPLTGPLSDAERERLAELRSIRDQTLRVDQHELPTGSFVTMRTKTGWTTEQMIEANALIAREGWASSFPAAPLTPRDVEHLVENRARFEWGYDSDDINRVLSGFESARLSCVWETFDDDGYGGSSEIVGQALGSAASGPYGVGRGVPKPRGSWRTIHPQAWEYLTDPDSDLDPEQIPSLLSDEVAPEPSQGGGPALDDMSGDGLHNMAVRAVGFDAAEGEDEGED